MSGCSAGEFQCAGGECIADYKRCNGYRDCVSGNDEEDCDDPTGNFFYKNFIYKNTKTLKLYIFYISLFRIYLIINEMGKL